MTDWNTIINQGDIPLIKFAIGEWSGRQLYNQFRNGPAGGEVRSLLRNRGVTYARRLARKALKRRGY